MQRLARAAVRNRRVVVVPWQDDAAKLPNGTPRKENIPPFALRAVRKSLLLADLLDKIVETFEGIHKGKG